MSAQVDCVLRGRAQLGECPLWHAEERVLYWTDIFGQTLNRFDPRTGVNAGQPTAERINSFGFRAGGGLVAGCWKGFALLDSAGAVEKWLWDLSGELPGYFLNDGKCDRRGRFWAGTVNQNYLEDGGALYCLGGDGSIGRKTSGVYASNGIAFSPDDSIAYYADSHRNLVWAFDFDIEAATVSNRRVFAEMHRPDGATVDAEGCYWVASFGDGAILRWTPDGRLDRRIELPVSTPSMCCFGGPALDTLFVTTGTFRLTEEQLREQELAGSLFAISGLGASGLPEPLFNQ